MVRFILQCNPPFERISRNINAENSHRSGEEYTYCLPKGQYGLNAILQISFRRSFDFLLNMASSSIISTNIIIIIIIIIIIMIIIIIIIVHRRRRPKSLIRFGKSLNEWFPAYEEEEKKTPSTWVRKYLLTGTILRLLLEAGQSFSVVIRATRRTSLLQGEGSALSVAFKPLCKRQHPQIVRFSSLYNAYFDKICHSHDCCVAQNVL